MRWIQRLFGLAARRHPDMPVTVWATDEGQRNHLVRAVGEDLAANRRVAVLAHFKEALLDAGKSLAAADLPFDVWGHWSAGDTARWIAGDAPPVVLCLASALPAASEPAPGAAPTATRASDAVPLSIRVVELHVLPDANERVARWAAALPAAARVGVSISLENPIMTAFAKPWVRRMLAGMGLRDDESLESPMITRGVYRSLRKLAGGVSGHKPADSLAEWMERNLRRSTG